MLTWLLLKAWHTEPEELSVEKVVFHPSSISEVFLCNIFKQSIDIILNQHDYQVRLMNSELKRYSDKLVLLLDEGLM